MDAHFLRREVGASSGIQDLDSDVLFRIFEYLQGDLRGLRSLGETCRWFRLLIFEDPLGECLFPRKSRRFTKNCFSLKNLFVEYCPIKKGKRVKTFEICGDGEALADQKDPETLGILPVSQEVASLCYSHPHLVPPRGTESAGYFGFDILSQELIVWGDFSGLSFWPSVSAFLKSGQRRENPGTDNPPEKYLLSIDNQRSDRPEDPCIVSSEARASSPRRPYGFLFGSDQQVMAVHLHHNDVRASFSDQQSLCSDLLFVGLASGKIHCISVTRKTNHHRAQRGEGRHENEAEAPAVVEEYPYLSCYTEQALEIADLAGTPTGHLISTHIRSPFLTVHLDALHTGLLNSTVRIQTPAPVLSLATTHGPTSTAWGGDSFFLATGLVAPEDQQRYPAGNPESYVPDLELRHYGCRRHEWPGSDACDHEVVASGRWHATTVGRVTNQLEGKVGYLKFLDHRYLIAGTSEGRVMVFQPLTPRDDDDKDCFARSYRLSRACRGGCLEAAEMVGSVIITCGGSDGSIQFWNKEDGSHLGRVLIHPGRVFPASGIPGRPPPPTLYASAVVGFRMFHDRSSILCLCRDGHVREWSFGEELERARTRARPRKRAPGVLPGPSRRSSRARAGRG